MNVFITGCSRGLGKALSEKFMQDNHTVYGTSRTMPDFDLTEHFQIDLSVVDNIKSKLGRFKEDIDILFLNAGVLGVLAPQNKVVVQELKSILEVNLFAQKELLDVLLSKVSIGRVICISSGAANKCRVGWGNYALSKASLKMLMHIYAVENPDTHFLSLAPGLIDTNMQREVYNSDEKLVPSVSSFRDKKDGGLIESPKTIADTIYNFLEQSSSYDTGAFIDLRNI